MTGTDVRDALHAVADTTHAPTPDRLAFQRLVRQERRRRLGGRLVIGVAAASVAAAGVAALGVLPGDRSVPPVVTPYVTGVADLHAPVHLVADGVLVAVDPQGARHDLGRAEEVVGWTTEAVFYVGSDSQLLRRDLATSDEGPGGWTWSEPEEVVGAVQSAQLSADGRWLGWVDLRERLHVQDLKAGSTADPVRLEGSGYLVDLAQGTGAALVADDRGLVLLTTEGAEPLPAELAGYDSSATRDLVAVVESSRTVLFEPARGRWEATAGSVPGKARLAPYGDALVSVADGAAFLWTSGKVRLDVPGEASTAAWGDDDTALVSTFTDRAVAVWACDVATAGEPCARLDVGTPTTVRLSR